MRDQNIFPFHMMNIKLVRPRFGLPRVVTRVLVAYNSCTVSQQMFFLLHVGLIAFNDVKDWSL